MYNVSVTWSMKNIRLLMTSATCASFVSSKLWRQTDTSIVGRKTNFNQTKVSRAYSIFKTLNFTLTDSQSQAKLQNRSHLFAIP